MIGETGNEPTICSVLLIEDEESLVSSLTYYLRKSGFKVASAMTGPAGLAAVRTERPDIVILDLMLPGIDGLEVCRRLRSESDVPIIILTARAEEMDRVVGLEVGADDYVTKPFSVRELAARIRALLRRSARHEQVRSQPTIAIASIEVDPRGRTVRRRGQEIALKPKEFDLLWFLVQHPDQVFTRQQLLGRVWGYDFEGGSRTIDVHIRWLREKLEDDPAQPQHLLTARGVGYKLVR
jgi:DNA-binding response OmpR family regulator